MDGWKMSFLLGFPIFRGYVKLQGGMLILRIFFLKIAEGEQVEIAMFETYHLERCMGS